LARELFKLLEGDKSNLRGKRVVCGRRFVSKHFKNNEVNSLVACSWVLPTAGYNILKKKEKKSKFNEKN
jgi:hypothetical protein